jgi:hypothetical protein
MTYRDDDYDNEDGNDNKTGKEVARVKPNAVGHTRPAPTGGLAGYVASRSANEIAGTILKFAKGDFLEGKDQPVPIGERFVFHPESVAIGFQIWVGGKVVESHMGLVADNFVVPLRRDLGHHDRSVWEKDANGDLRDPCQECMKMQLARLSTGGVYTFSAPSVGARGAIDKLCQEYVAAMDRHPDEFPIIELQVDSYAHKNKAFGRIKFPVFKIVDWIGKDAVSAAPAQEQPQKPQKPAPVEKNPLADDGAPPPGGPDDYGFDDDDGSSGPPF